MDGPAFGGRQDPYDVLLVKRDGTADVFQSHRQRPEPQMKHQSDQNRVQCTRRDGLKLMATAGAAVLESACSVPQFKGGVKQEKARISEKTGITTPATSEIVLSASAASVRLVPDERPDTQVWAYDGQVPGTLLTSRQGDALRIGFRNNLPDASTVHWHGIRNSNAMDGVPFLTQDPVSPGELFQYDLSLPDAGTYWYHPHLGTPEQVGRGLYGALIVHEPDPPRVDRDIVWLIDDWRLDGHARIIEDFYKWSDVAFGGRIGNTVTVNGIEHHREPVASGERIRLRLINVANARLVSLFFGEHPAWLVALDANPLSRPIRLNPNRNVFLGPGQRADLIVDMNGEPGQTVPVLDRFRPNRVYPVAHFQYAGNPSAGTTRQQGKRQSPDPLVPNEIPEPEETDQMRVKIVMDGGMMRGPSIPWTERAALRLRQWGGSREAYPSWSLNGKAHMSHGKEHEFEFTADRGRTVLLTYENRSSLWHPMHLHGHAFRELTRNGRPVPMTPWRDTTMVAPRETLEIAFVADNPGDWLIHCHILEHHAGGMGTQFRVTT